MARTLAVVALAGGVLCLTASGTRAQPAAAPPGATPPSSQPRWLAHVTIHPGIALVDDDADDGASSPGVALGMQAGVQLRLSSVISVGAALDATFSEHETEVSPTAKAKYTSYFLPVLVGRLELGRVVVTSWAGFELGHRSVREPGGVFTSTTYSEDSMRGIVVALAALVRVRLPVPQPIHFEIGPYAQTARFGTDADSSVKSLVLGLVFQGAFNAPSITGGAPRSTRADDNGKTRHQPTTHPPPPKRAPKRR
jgi:hypothetical protein